MQGEAFFPQDFPDTHAAASHAAMLQAERQALRTLRPKGRFAPGPPLPPDWSILDTTSTRQAQSDAQDAAPMQGAAAEADNDAGQLRAAPGEAPVDAEPMVEASSLDPAPEEGQVWTEAGPARGSDHGPSGVAAHPQAASPAAGLLPAACYVARSLPVLQAAMAGTTAVAPEAANGTGRLWRAKGEPDPACMVRVSLRVLGPGTAEEGAALHALSPSEASSARTRIVQRKQRRESVPADRPDDDSVVLQSLCFEHADGREVIGYVTAGAPRGLPPWRGATAVCRASALWCQRRVARDTQVWPGTALVAFRDAGTPTWRLAEAVMVVNERVKT